MPSDKVPGSEPKTPEYNVAKSLSLEEFKKLKVGDNIWVIRNIASWGKNQTDDVSPMIIDILNEDSVQLRQPGKVYPISFLIADFLNHYKVFLKEADGEKELKRQTELN